MRLKSVNPKELSLEALRVFPGRTPLLTAGDKAACNTMTIGWAAWAPFGESPFARCTCAPPAIPFNLWRITTISPCPSCLRTARTR